MIISRFFPVLAAFALAGCAGYVQGPIKPTPMANVKTIAVPNFVNDTLETRVEVQLANSLIKQIQQDGTYRIADEKSADAILEGKLEQIQRKPERSVQGNTLLSKEYELILSVSYRITDRVTGKELVRRTVRGQTTFFVSGSNALAADVLQDERQALPLAAEDLAIRLVSQISEGW